MRVYVLIFKVLTLLATWVPPPSANCLIRQRSQKFWQAHSSLQRLSVRPLTATPNPYNNLDHHVCRRFETGSSLLFHRSSVDEHLICPRVPKTQRGFTFCLFHQRLRRRFLLSPLFLSTAGCWCITVREKQRLVRINNHLFVRTKFLNPFRDQRKKQICDSTQCRDDGKGGRALPHPWIKLF